MASGASRIGDHWTSEEMRNEANTPSWTALRPAPSNGAWCGPGTRICKLGKSAQPDGMACPILQQQLPRTLHLQLATCVHTKPGIVRCVRCSCTRSLVPRPALRWEPACSGTDPGSEQGGGYVIVRSSCTTNSTSWAFGMHEKNGLPFPAALADRTVCRKYEAMYPIQPNSLLRDPFPATSLWRDEVP